MKRKRQWEKIDEKEMETLLAEIRWDERGLIPAIVQDTESKEVLMLAYMNRDALGRTLAGGRTCFFSRSRQELWVKGETSGHVQEVVDVHLDCDRDTILVRVRQTGMACHENYFSCFHYALEVDEDRQVHLVTAGKPHDRPIPQREDGIELGNILAELAEVVACRNAERPEGAYTTYLFEKGLDKILKKVGEETAEVLIAAKNRSEEELSYEVADLLYHLLVLLEEQKVGLERIARELASRRK